MGRPLKIAKAQAVLTLTDTVAATDVITVSGSLTTAGVIAGMPFIPATTVGGLTGGTTYYVLTVLSSTTFTASATELSANPSQTVVPLSDTSSQTVKLTVGLVGSGFNNPPGASYGVVGGNTNLYGKQILCNVAIGQSGTGTIYTSNADSNIYGVGTDFANTLASGSAIQVLTANVNGSTNATTIGFTNSTGGYVTVTTANVKATGDFIRTSAGNCSNLVSGAPIVFSASVGPLVAGTIYFAKTLTNASAFTVSATSGGANIDISTDENFIGTGTQDIATMVSVTADYANVSYVFSTAEPGYITRQKGKTKYLVTGNTTSITNACYTANVANAALTANTFNILSTNAASGTAYVQSVNDYQSIIFGVDMAANGLATGNPGIIGTFNTAYAANTEIGDKPVVVISNT